MQIFVVTPCITWAKVLEYPVYRKVSSVFMYYKKKWAKETNFKIQNYSLELYYTKIYTI